MQRTLLFLSLTLFVLWTGWLAYLAATSADPVVVSRPQMHLAPIILVADLGPPANQRVQAQIKQIYKGKDQLPAGDSPLTLAWSEKLCGWHGPGLYLLAVQRPLQAGDAYALVPIPLSPGYVGLDHTDFHGRRHEPPDVYHVVYPWSASVKVQVEMILGKQGP